MIFPDILIYIGLNDKRYNTIYLNMFTLQCIFCRTPQNRHGKFCSAHQNENNLCAVRLPDDQGAFLIFSAKTISRYICIYRDILAYVLQVDLCVEVPSYREESVVWRIKI